MAWLVGTERGSLRCTGLFAARSPLTIQSIAAERPILPVLLRDTPIELAPDPIGETQLVDLRVRSPESTIALLTAIQHIAAALPKKDPRRASLEAAAKVHADAGIANVSAEHYEGSHWLASFATYLVTQRGLTAGGPTN